MPRRREQLSVGGTERFVPEATESLLNDIPEGDAAVMVFTLSAHQSMGAALIYVARETSEWAGLPMQAVRNVIRVGAVRFVRRALLNPSLELVLTKALDCRPSEADLALVQEYGDAFLADAELNSVEEMWSQMEGNPGGAAIKMARILRSAAGLDPEGDLLMESMYWSSAFAAFAEFFDTRFRENWDLLMEAYESD